MAALSIRGLSKRYANLEVLKGIDLDIESGEFTVLVGPSGCGKSTLLNIVAGLDRPSAGTVEIGGRVVNDIPPKDRDIAMVFQSYALYPSMTVRQNITFGMECRHVPRAEQEAAGECGPAAADRTVARPPAVAAFRRPASARRDGPRAGAGSPAVPVRRTALQSRRQTARRDADGDQAAASAHRRHHRLCHPRPDRGDDDGDADRGDASGRGAAIRRSRIRCTAIRPICSWRVSWARRR